MAYTAHFPISSFLDVDGKPLENGYVYIGTAGLDPVGNPITVYWDAAATQVAAQPIRTIGGYPSNNGVRSRLYVNAVDYSIKVTNVNGTDTVPVALYNAEDAYAGDIIFLQAGAGAVARTVESKLRDTVSVKDFGAVGNGVADDTVAIQTAINSFPSGRGTVIFPVGTYKVTSTITVSQDRIHLVGAGSWATQILFAPTASGSCIRLYKGPSVLFQGSVVGISFFSNDATYVKNALEVVDVSGYNIEDIVIGGSVVAGGSTFWSGGAGSRGLWFKGREATNINRVYIYADKPIEVSDNPNSSIDIDHFHFENCYLAANGFGCVNINNNINLTNVTFDGYQVWALGTYGLYWVDSTSVGVSQNLRLQNIRTEQGTDATAYSFYILHNTSLQSLMIENCQLDLTRNGIYLRRVERASIYNVIDTSSSGTHTNLNVDATVREIDIRNCYWNTGAIASLTGQNVVFSTQGPITAALPATALYTSVTNPMTITRAANTGYEISLADTAVASLGPITTAGMLTVVDSEYFSAIFNLRGTYTVTSEVSDPVGVFSPTAGGAGTTNIYWSAANNRYEIQNLRGVDRRYKIILNGTYESF